MASGSGDGKVPDLPRGLIDRRGAPAGKARLKSLRSPRDLTLGGIPKRVFVPNIPVRKEKTAADNGQPETKQKEKQSKEKAERGRGRGRGRDGRGRGRGRGESNLIQIQSVFEQGPSVQKVRGQESSRVVGGGGGPTKSFKPEYQFHSDAKKKEMMDLLMRDDFIEDEEGEEDTEDMTPLKLPREVSLLLKREAKTEEWEPGSLPIIKQEPGEPRETDSPSDKTDSLIPDALSEGFQSLDLSCGDLLMKASKSGKEHLGLFQLPAMLPGISTISEEEQAAEGSTSKDEKNEKSEEDEEKPNQSSLRCFSEGYLGKLRVRKSGKVELVLGDHVLDVSMGLPPSCLQEVVSVRTDEGDRRMTMLGHVRHQMVVTPNFDSILQAMSCEDK